LFVEPVEFFIGGSENASKMEIQAGRTYCIRLACLRCILLLGKNARAVFAGAK